MIGLKLLNFRHVYVLLGVVHLLLLEREAEALVKAVLVICLIIVVLDLCDGC